MSSIKLKLYLLDRIKIDSSQHRAYKKLTKYSLQQFPKVIAIGSRIKNEDMLQILINKKLCCFQMEASYSEEDKINICFDLLKCIWFIQQCGYFMGNQSIQQFLLINKQWNKIQFKYYLTVPVQQFQWGQVKKDKILAKNGIQLCYDVQKIAYKLDIWKWAIFTSTLFYKFSIDKYIDKIFGGQKIQQFIPQISATKNSFFGNQQFVKILQKCLRINPKDRPDIQDIMKIYRKLIANQTLSIDQQILTSASKLYTSQQSQLKVQSSLQPSQTLHLTEKLKKKLNNNFVRYGKKSPTAYKLLYRAIKYNFSSRIFYQQCSNINNIIFVIDTDDFGIICAYIQPKIYLCQNGLNGNFIQDHQDKCFIYQDKIQTCFKLASKDKAFRSVPGYGPIIGDGDIILGNNRNNNWCYFPRSYNGGSKKLTTKPQFTIKNYDVYKVIF